MRATSARSSTELTVMAPALRSRSIAKTLVSCKNLTHPYAYDLRCRASFAQNVIPDEGVLRMFIPDEGVPRRKEVIWTGGPWRGDFWRQESTNECLDTSSEEKRILR
ncbi:uncharacterized protein LOC114253968 [Monomorium pharaonis]|uniref:uncharacterized protein LOC114253968 n=1 Tax=Monomorium pharaonis TaxID=307658 RepID=UPI00102E1806|nr:uncharacterized protein LOC114253968 [Monomorium pharaonis]